MSSFNQNYERKILAEGVHNRVILLYPYGCHVGFLLSWRRENEERKDNLPLAKR
jgi:hypothetical protein